jgi:hypothetical protein
MSDRRIWREVDPPRRVLVNPLRVWPPRRLRWGSVATPLERTQGVPVTRPVIGYLSAWVRSSCGDWLGLVEWTVRADGEDIPQRALVHADALKPAEL